MSQCAIKRVKWYITNKKRIITGVWGHNSQIITHQTFPCRLNMCKFIKLTQATWLEEGQQGGGAWGRSSHIYDWWLPPTTTRGWKWGSSPGSGFENQSWTRTGPERTWCLWLSHNHQISVITTELLTNVRFVLQPSLPALLVYRPFM